MQYNSVIVSQHSGPEVFRMSDRELREPNPGEARIKVSAVPVCAPAVSARKGKSPSQ